MIFKINIGITGINDGVLSNHSKPIKCDLKSVLWLMVYSGKFENNSIVTKMLQDVRDEQDIKIIPGNVEMGYSYFNTLLRSLQTRKTFEISLDVDPGLPDVLQGITR